MRQNKLKTQLVEFEEFIELLGGVGINANRGRIRSYLKYLKDYIDAVENGSAKNLQITDEYRDYTNAFYEITELLEVYDGIKDIEKNSDLVERLKKYVSGPIFIGDEDPETGNTNARDIGFELFIGSRLLRAGLKVDFNDEGDVKVLGREQNIYLECKRISSIKQIEKKFKKALRQLDEKYINDPTAKGIAAISLSKIYNPNHLILVGQDKSSLLSLLNAEVMGFFKSYQSLWDRITEKRTIGVFVLLSTLTYNQSNNTIQMTTFIGLLLLCDEHTADYQLLTGIYNELRVSFP